MGLSLGHSSGSSSGETTQNTQSSGTGVQSNTYSPWQQLLQGQLGGALSSLLTGIVSGNKSPNVQAMQNNSADQINQGYSGLSDRMTKFLASRGFGKSGTVGSDQLKAEIGRQGALAANNANYSGLQLQQNQSTLNDALAAAFASMGMTGSTTGQQSGRATQEGQTSGTSIGGGISIPIPGFK